MEFLNWKGPGWWRLGFGPQTPGDAGPGAAPPAAQPERKGSMPSLGKAVTMGWLVLLLGGGGFFAWAAFAPLDQGVTANGQVVVTGHRKTVQSLGGGLISEILVKEGDEVTAGQPLLLIDTTPARAQLETARSQWIVARAMEARLIAERDGARTVSFPADLRAVKDEPAAAQAMALQSRLFGTRRSVLETELATFEKSIAGLRAQITGVEAARGARQTQLKLLREELEHQRALAAEGYLPRNRVSEQERLFAQLEGQVAEDAATIARARTAIGEAELRSVGRRSEYRQQSETQLSDTQREVTSLASRIEALRFELQNTEVRAPASGFVVGLRVFTAGGVVQGGAPLMDIIPADEPLRIEASIPTQFIDKVHPGLEVDVMFPAFSQKQTPHVEAQVKQVSADVLVNERTGEPYYRAYVEVTPKGMEKLVEHQIKPGMQAEVFIRTGERTALNYLIKPVFDRVRSAMTEE